jgi:hypothetical protein
MLMSGGRNLKLLEEHIRHIAVVVLGGMNQALLDLGILPERAEHGRDFHEIWTRANYVKNMHAGPLPPGVLSPKLESIAGGTTSGA